jgi:hypothetical protein
MFLGIALALLNLVLWYATPWMRNAFDTLTGQFTSPYRPTIVTGVQELLVYYDPWLARAVFPVLYTLGFVAIAALSRSATASTSSITAILLFTYQAVWLLLIAIGICCRGPNWNFYWPWEAWNSKPIVLIPLINYSEGFWYSTCEAIPVHPWILREAPGLLLALGYFILGLLISRTMRSGAGQAVALSCCVLLIILAIVPLSHRMLGLGAFEGALSVSLALAWLVVMGYLFLRLPGAGRSADSSMSWWRCALLVILLQAAALVPLKVLLYWTLQLKYFIHVPEYNVYI